MCFTLGWIEQLCVNLVFIITLVSITRLVIPWLSGWIGIPLVGQIIMIVLWAVIAVFCIYVIFGLLSCAGDLHFGRMIR